jgi:MraZ protein
MRDHELGGARVHFWDGRASRWGSGGLRRPLRPGTFGFTAARGLRRSQMTQFLGTHTNKLDKKGRVSVPAQFRSTLERLGDSEIILRPSHRAACIEAWPRREFEAMAEGMTRYDAFSDAYDDMAAALFAEAWPVTPDGEGRMSMPQELIDHAGLGEQVAFVGAGKIFQIWDPEAAKRRTVEAKLRARDRGLTLPSTGAAPARPPA